MEGNHQRLECMVVVGRRSVVGGEQLVMRALSDEDDIVDERCDGGAHEGAKPVHPVVLPDAGDDGRAEGHGRVHGGAVECAAGEDVGSDDEADGDGRDDAEVALLGVAGPLELYRLKYVSPFLRASTCFKRYNPLVFRVTSR
jgi:hypothetical protein